MRGKLGLMTFLEGRKSLQPSTDEDLMGSSRLLMLPLMEGSEWWPQSCGHIDGHMSVNISLISKGHRLTLGIACSVEAVGLGQVIVARCCCGWWAHR